MKMMGKIMVKTVGNRLESGWQRWLESNSRVTMEGWEPCTKLEGVCISVTNRTAFRIMCLWYSNAVQFFLIFSEHLEQVQCC